MTENTLEPWQWGAIVIMFAFVLYVVSSVITRLWRAWREPEPPPTRPPYDWAKTDALEAWERDAEGEVLSVIPAAWYLRAEDAK